MNTISDIFICLLSWAFMITISVGFVVFIWACAYNIITGKEPFESHKKKHHTQNINITFNIKCEDDK